MIVAIHQPNLFPRLKILQKLALADIWIVLDNVQYCQREYQNRTLIVPKEKRHFGVLFLFIYHLANLRKLIK